MSIGFRQGYDVVLDAVLSTNAKQVLSQGYVTPEFDLTVNQSGLGLIPSTPGFYFIPNRWSFFFKTLAGVFTGALTVGCGNNATQDNILAATGAISAAVLNTAETAPGTPSALSGTAIVQPTAGHVFTDLGTPVTLKTTGATGGTGRGRFIVFGVLIPST